MGKSYGLLLSVLCFVDVLLFASACPDVVRACTYSPRSSALAPFSSFTSTLSFGGKTYSSIGSHFRGFGLRDGTIDRFPDTDVTIISLAGCPSNATAVSSAYSSKLSESIQNGSFSTLNCTMYDKPHRINACELKRIYSEVPNSTHEGRKDNMRAILVCLKYTHYSFDADDHASTINTERRSPKLPLMMEAVANEGSVRLLKLEVEDPKPICLRYKPEDDGLTYMPFLPSIDGDVWLVARDDVFSAQTSTHDENSGIIVDILKNDCNTFECAVLEINQSTEEITEHGSVETKEHLLAYYRAPLEGFSGHADVYCMTTIDLANRTSMENVTDHTADNRQRSLPSGRQHPARRRNLLQSANPAASPPPLVPDPSPPPPYTAMPPPSTVITPPPPDTAIPPPSPVIIPPPAIAFPPPSTVNTTPPLPSPTTLAPSPPKLNLLALIISAPDVYQITNVSVFLTGVMIPFISIKPSSILLSMENILQKRSVTGKLPSLHHRERMATRRRFRQLLPVPVLDDPTPMAAATPPPPDAAGPNATTPPPNANATAPSPAANATITPPPVNATTNSSASTSPPAAPAPGTWQPKTPGISSVIRVILQVDSGSLLLVLPGYLVEDVLHQPTSISQWVPMQASTDPWDEIPGAGIQFQGTNLEINAALGSLQFGLGLGTGKSRTCTLSVMAYHMFTNGTAYGYSKSSKFISLKVTGAGAWFTIFQYTKRFYQSSVGVLCTFALMLLTLCCILGCCMCHDTKMEKLFEKNRLTLKGQNTVFNETRVFNPIWIPSAALTPGEDGFVVSHNPKFVRQRQADHLSSLHGPVVEPGKIVNNFSSDGLVLDAKQQQASSTEPGKEMVSNAALPPPALIDNELIPAIPRGGPDSGVELMSTRPSSVPSTDGTPNSGTDPDSHSTHYTIRETRGAPYDSSSSPTRRLSSTSSNTTLYDIGSPTSRSGNSDEAESRSL